MRRFKLWAFGISDLVEPIARTHAALGTKKAWIVHGLDGLDEITVSDKTFVAEVENGEVRLFEISPEEFGFNETSVKDLEKIRGGNAEQNAEIIKKILKNERTDAARDLVLLNAAAAIFVGGKAENLENAVELAKESLESGNALQKLEIVDRNVK